MSHLWGRQLASITCAGAVAIAHAAAVADPQGRALMSLGAGFLGWRRTRPEFDPL